MSLEGGFFVGGLGGGEALVQIEHALDELDHAVVVRFGVVIGGKYASDWKLGQINCAEF